MTRAVSSTISIPDERGLERATADLARENEGQGNPPMTASMG